ncbi:hypothetical protein CYMTET_40560 [Cymbomonas tetramitiformis]|uniref:Amine oxidase domain-containing protein n=1 Tax=Cymbomonas tetramitiformis TaxID=36881 RepID=A0AAE0F4I5_9CHLO|nr:hypothetical protein CYMTET_40560 [Cymbomonas tetramitiformis]
MPVFRRPHVVIVGAGAAGLECARALKEQGGGIDITVLEARERVGGRCYAQDWRLRMPEDGLAPKVSADAWVDLGATWVHGVEGSPLADLAEECHVPLKRVCSGNPWLKPWLLGDQGYLGPCEAPSSASPGKGGYALYRSGRQLAPETVAEGWRGFQRLLGRLSEAAAADTPDTATASRTPLTAVLEGLRSDGGGSTEQMAVEEFGLHLIECWNGGALRQFLLEEFVPTADGLLGDFPGAHCVPGLAPVKPSSWTRAEAGGGGSDGSNSAAGGMFGLMLGLARVALAPEGAEAPGRDAINGAEVRRAAEIRLEAAVTEIVYNADVETATGALQSPGDAAVGIAVAGGERLTSDAVVVTVPLGVLKADAIRFDPPLPEAKRAAIRRLGFCAYMKVILEFSDCFWPLEPTFLGCLDHPGYGGAPRGRIRVFDNLQKLKGVPLLLGTAVGDDAEELRELDDTSVVEDALLSLRAMFGSGVPAPVASLVTRWSDDPWARGSYSFWTTETEETDIDVLAEPVGNQIFFAGEATDGPYQGAVHGAMLSGRRAAAEEV